MRNLPAALRAIAGALTTRGVKRGDRVAIFMTNRTEYLEAFYGIWFAGAAAVPINAKLHAKEAAWIIENAGAEILFVSEDVGAALRSAVPPCVREVIAADGPEFGRLYAAAPLPGPGAARRG